MIDHCDFDHRSYYNISLGRVVPIRSPVGQAQFFLNAVKGSFTAPNEWLLLCRFASTIDISCGEREMRQLKQLARHLDRHRFESRNGYADPVVSREVEREIVQRQAMDCAAGYDLTPAMRLLADYERTGPVFSQPERNLLLRDAFCFGDQNRIRELADELKRDRCSRHRLAAICRELEQTELSWVGLEEMDGLQYLPAMAPGSSVSLKNCEDPMAHYPPFACYPPLDLPENSVVLQNGILLFPEQEGWWRSGDQKVDQTYAAPHFYKADGEQTYTIADQEHQELFIGRAVFAGRELQDFTDPEDNQIRQCIAGLTEYAAQLAAQGREEQIPRLRQLCVEMAEFWGLTEDDTPKGCRETADHTGGVFDSAVSAARGSGQTPELGEQVKQNILDGLELYAREMRSNDEDLEQWAAECDVLAEDLEEQWQMEAQTNMEMGGM